MWRAVLISELHWRGRVADLSMARRSELERIAPRTHEEAAVPPSVKLGHHGGGGRRPGRNNSSAPSWQTSDRVTLTRCAWFAMSRCFMRPVH
eukprot:scaffold75019_cov66-Phaeocystis_antarctica.AAC.2